MDPRRLSMEECYLSLFVALKKWRLIFGPHEAPFVSSLRSLASMVNVNFINCLICYLIFDTSIIGIFFIKISPDRGSAWSA
jgi:hypothetical protein